MLPAPRPPSRPATAVTRPVRTRFAPSPTGPLHIGGARTALFCWALARQAGGQFLLRIEDTDPERSERRFEEEILAGFRWLGIDWDEGPDRGGPHAPYRQSERLDLHLGVAAQLRRAGWAYPCFCSRERLDALREAQTARRETARYDGHCRGLGEAELAAHFAAGAPFVLRFAVPPGTTRFEDRIRGLVTFEHGELDDWVMVRADGAPTYNFVCVCDDAAMEISHVVRGEEHLVNTPKQILLYAALGLEPPVFAHLPLMLGAGGKKMSKRDGDTGLAEYREKGYPAAALVNFLCLQGWALDGSTEVFGVDELVAHFRLEAVSKGGSRFDLAKLDWLSAEYLRRESPEELLGHVLPFLAGIAGAEDAAAPERRPWLQRALATVRERAHTYLGMAQALGYLFVADTAVSYDQAAEVAARKQGSATLAAWLDWARPQLDGEPDPATLGSATKAWLGERGAKIPALFQPLRLALTGQGGGPDLFEVIALLGGARTVARAEEALRRLA
jgi:nondiscriminating glutamyl-tRNA synthetase